MHKCTTYAALGQHRALQHRQLAMTYRSASAAMAGWVATDATALGSCIASSAACCEAAAAAASVSNSRLVRMPPNARRRSSTCAPGSGSPGSSFLHDRHSVFLQRHR